MTQNQFTNRPFKFDRAVASVTVSSEAFALLIELAHQQNYEVSQIASIVLNQALMGETRIRFAAGKSASLNAVRCALLAASMNATELVRVSGFSFPTIRACVTRLDASGEISQKRAASSLYGRPSALWSLTEEGYKVCDALKLKKSEGDFNPDVTSDDGTPHERIRQAFVEKPTKDWTISDLVNETKHSNPTVRKVVFILTDSGYILEGDKRRTTGKAALTYRLNPSRQVVPKPEPVARISAVPLFEPIKAEVDISQEEWNTCGTWETGDDRLASEVSAELQRESDLKHALENMT